MKVGELWAELGIDRTQMRAGLQALKRESREAVQSVEKDASKAGDKIPKTFGEAFKKSGGHADAFNNKLSLLNKSIGGGIEKTGLFSRTMSFIKWPALIAGAQAAAGAVGAVAAAAFQAVSAAAPLVGLMPAIGAGMLATRQGMLVVKLASVGVADALGEIASEGKASAETMAKLAPAARPFVAEVQKLSPAMREMRETAAAGLFPGVTDAVRTLAPMMARLRPIIRGTAEVMGELAREGAEMVAGWGRDLTTVGQSNQRILRNLGAAGLALADAFRHVLVEVQPLTRWLSRVAVASAESTREFFASARASGSMAEFFGRTRTVATQLGHVLMNIGTTLLNVAQAAEPFGRNMFATFEKVTGGWARFTGSVRGQNVLTEFFRDAQPAIREVGLLLRDIVGFFFDMARQQNLGPLIKQIRTEFLPVLKAVGLSAGKELLPALVDLATQVVRLFKTFGTETGTLVGFVKVMGTFLDVVQDLVGENKGLQNTLVTIGALAGVGSSLGVGQLVSYVFQMRQAVLLQRLLNAELVRTGAAGATAAGGVGTFGAALRNLPLIGLIGGFAILKTKVNDVLSNFSGKGGFQEVIVSGIQGAARVIPGLGPLFDNLGADAKKLRRDIGDSWQSIQNVTQRVWDAIREFLANKWAQIRESASFAWDRLREGVVALWQRVREIFASGVGAVVNFMGELPGRIVNAIASLGRMLFNAAKEHLGRFVEGLRDRAVGMLNFFKQLPERILGAIGNLAKLLYDKGKQLVRGLIDGIIDAAKGIGSAVGGAVSKGVAALNPFGDGMGVLGTAKAGTPGAMMNWAIGQYDSGLHPTSGYRPGAITTSGNTSLHSVPPPNNAWDFAGPAGAMVAAARGIAGRFGRGIRELIHTPLGFGIKNGQKVGLDFWGPTVNAMHYSHVHVAKRGFHGDVARPTLILAGEAGRERVDVSPNGQGSAPVINVNVYGDWSDLDNFERRVSAAINRGVERRGW